MTNKNNDVHPDEGNEECPDDDGVVPENQSIATTAMVCNTNQAAAITKINNIIKVIRIEMITNLFIALNLQKEFAPVLSSTHCPQEKILGKETIR
jgi:hypothetical protein